MVQLYFPAPRLALASGIWVEVMCQRHTLWGRNVKSLVCVAPHRLPCWLARFLIPAALLWWILEKRQRQEPQLTQDGLREIDCASALWPKMLRCGGLLVQVHPGSSWLRTPINRPPGSSWLHTPINRHRKRQPKPRTMGHFLTHLQSIFAMLEYCNLP